MIGGIIKGITGVAGKVTDTIKHKNDLKFKAQEMQHNYLKEKVSIGLFTFIAITVVLPYFFWVLSPFFKYLPFMTDILNDYQTILNTITLDRIFTVVFTLLGVGGSAAITTGIGKVMMARKKADKDAEIKKEEIKAGIVGDDHVSIKTNSRLNKVQEFVKKFGPLAEQIEKDYDLPADGILAHAALETGWGKHILKGRDYESGEEIETNNIFNIKTGSTWQGRAAVKKAWEIEGVERVDRVSTFRVYRNHLDSFEDYAKLLTGLDRYKNVRTAQNAEQYGKALYKCGYMTDPDAPEKIKKIAAKYFIYET